MIFERFEIWLHVSLFYVQPILPENKIKRLNQSPCHCKHLSRNLRTSQMMKKMSRIWTNTVYSGRACRRHDKRNNIILLNILFISHFLLVKNLFSPIFLVDISLGDLKKKDFQLLSFCISFFTDAQTSNKYFFIQEKESTIYIKS